MITVLTSPDSRPVRPETHKAETAATCTAPAKALKDGTSSRICGCDKATGVYCNWLSLTFWKKTVVDVTGS